MNREIGDFIDECWKPPPRAAKPGRRRAQRARPRTGACRVRRWPTGRRRRSAAARSASSTSRPRSKAAARSKRLQLVFGGAARLAAIGGVVVLALGVGGGDDGGDGRAGARARRRRSSREQQTTDIEEAAKAAGCKLTNPQYEGAGHEEQEFTADRLQDQPADLRRPLPDWYEDGIYEPGTTPRPRQARAHARARPHQRPVQAGHARGRPSTSSRRSSPRNDGYHMLLYQNTTEHGRRGRRDRVDALAGLHGDERRGLRRPADLPRPLHRQGPGEGPLGALRR